MTTPIDPIREALADLDIKRAIPYEAIRYVPGFDAGYVKEYAAAQVEAALKAKDAEIEALRVLLADASKLLKRSPPAALGMYIGRDRKSFGAQAKELAAAIDAALKEPS